MRVLLLISIFMLGACTRQSEATLPTAWARADGRPVVAGLLDIASVDCKDDIRKPEGTDGRNAHTGGYSQAMVDGFVSCMRERGYVQIKS
jgi:hypothetical protein